MIGSVLQQNFLHLSFFFFLLCPLIGRSYRLIIGYWWCSLLFFCWRWFHCLFLCLSVRGFPHLSTTKAPPYTNESISEWMDMADSCKGSWDFKFSVVKRRHRNCSAVIYICFTLSLCSDWPAGVFGPAHMRTVGGVMRRGWCESMFVSVNSFSPYFHVDLFCTCEQSAGQQLVVVDVC